MYYEPPSNMILAVPPKPATPITVIQSAAWTTPTQPTNVKPIETRKEPKIDKPGKSTVNCTVGFRQSSNVVYVTG